MTSGVMVEEQLLLDAARVALSRAGTLAAARAALDGEPASDIWVVAERAGWPGLLVSERHGGAGLGTREAALVLQECGRVLAAVPLLGHLLATFALERAADPPAELLSALATGSRRACIVAAQPPDQRVRDWTVDGGAMPRRRPAPQLSSTPDGVRVSGAAAFVPDAPPADVFVVVGTDASGGPQAVLVDRDDAQVTPVMRFDATRALGHVRFESVPATPIELDADALEAVWFLGQQLIAAESLGAVEACLEMSVAYAKDRYAFARPIGSFQAIKHKLTEVLRQQENARAVVMHAATAHADETLDYRLASAAARLLAGRALEFAAHATIAVHGGIGATWEHDAHLYLRRAVVNRLILGGTEPQADRVADELLRAAAAGDMAAAGRPGG